MKEIPAVPIWIEIDGNSSFGQLSPRCFRNGVTVVGVLGFEDQRVLIKDLNAHPDAYVSVAQLAAYWLVGRKQIYKQIDAGTLRALRLGPRSLRIRTADAIEFERLANMGRPTRQMCDSVERPVRASAADHRR